MTTTTAAQRWCSDALAATDGNVWDARAWLKIQRVEACKRIASTHGRERQNVYREINAISSALDKLAAQ